LGRAHDRHGGVVEALAHLAPPQLVDAADRSGIGAFGGARDGAPVVQLEHPNFHERLREARGEPRVVERAAIELSKEWRTDKVLRHLEALLVVADEKGSYLLSGNGDVISPDDEVLAIGSGGSYALAAARALVVHTKLSAKEIALEALKIAGEICIYSNTNIVVEEL